MKYSALFVAALAVLWMSPAMVSAQAEEAEKAAEQAEEAAGEAEAAAESAEKAAEEAEQAAAEATASATEPAPAAEPEPVAAPAPEPYVPSTDSSSDEDREDILPLRLKFNGYYRARYNWINNVPINGTNPVTGTPYDKKAHFGTMRLRMEPRVEYGPDEDLPIARLQITIDGLDNVVFGDNARINNVPILSVQQSATNTDGFDLNDTLVLKRAWIEFLVPFGQLRVGRMQSHWVTGLLTHAGNDLAEWGDFDVGETFDRILFITRPLTIYNALAKGDSRKTPLVYGFVYDRLSQDPVNDPTDGNSPPTFTYAPYFSTADQRSTAPFAYLTGRAERTHQIVNAIAWFDEDWGNAEDDELFLGVYSVYRRQKLTKTRIGIIDVGWRANYTMPKNGLTLKIEGEFYTIFGKSGALTFTQGCSNGSCNQGKARIYNVLNRVGVADEGRWEARLEGGFSSGDEDLLGNRKLTARAFNRNVKVGLLMYQVALRTASYQRLSFIPGGAALGANGSVWNSKYIYPSFRYFVLPEILELHAAFLAGWVHKRDIVVFGDPGTCGFKSSCFLGWEADLALRTKMGANDIMHIDIEGGVHGVGDALKAAGVTDDFMWTIQMRSAMVF